MMNINFLYVFFLLFNSAIFSAATGDEQQLTDFLSSPSPVTISFLHFLNRDFADAAPKYQALKRDILQLKDLPVSYDDSKLTMTFTLDPIEVDVCLRSTAFGKAHDMGDPFKHLRKEIAVDKHMITGSMSFFGGPHFVEWTEESREHPEHIRKALLNSAVVHNDHAVSRKRYVQLTKAPKGGLLRSLLHDHQGVVIGEIHDDPYPKEMLSRSMKKLVKQGVRAIFVENLAYDTMAESLEIAAASKDASLIPVRIKKFIKRLDESLMPIRGNPGYWRLVQAATAHGIVVIPIDTTHSRLVGWNRSHGIVETKSRLLAMNFVAASIIEPWMKKNPDKKFVVLTGCFHATGYYYNQDGERREVVGLADQLGVPSVFIGATTKKKSTVKINASAFKTKRNVMGRFSVVLRKSRQNSQLTK